MKDEAPSRGKAEWIASQQALNSCRPVGRFYSCLGGSNVCFVVVALVFFFANRYLGLSGSE